MAVSMLIARTVLPPAMRILAKYASAELYQLTIIAFCLVCGWLTGYLVRHQAPPRSPTPPSTAHESRRLQWQPTSWSRPLPCG